MNNLLSKLSEKIKERGILWLFFIFSDKVLNFFYLAKLKNKIGKKNIGENCYFDKQIEIKCRNIKIGDDVYIGRNVVLWGRGSIVIGRNTYISDYISIYADKLVEIGEYCNIASFSFIIDSDHGIRKGIKINDQPHITKEIKIGNDVWIAASCLITAGSVIEDGAVIAGNSVVKGHVPSNSVVAGSPAVIKKYRE